MKHIPGLYLLIGIFALLLILVSCQSFDNSSDNPVMVDVVFSIDIPQLSGSTSTAFGRTETRNAYVNTVIIAVVDGSTTAADFAWDLTAYSRDLMDLTSNTVSLSVPYDTPLKLVYISLFGTYTLAEAMSQQPNPNYIGLSDAFTLTSSTAATTVPISLIANSWQGTLQFGTTSSEWTNEMAVDDDGYIYVAGQTKGDLGGPNAGQYDFFLRKYSEDGNHIWTAQAGTSLSEDVTGIALDSTGDIYLTGTWNHDDLDSDSDYDYFIAKYDKSGALIERLTLGSSTQVDIGQGITVDASDNVYVTGMTASSTLNGMTKPDSAGQHDVFVSKYTPALSHVWTVFVDSTGDYDDYSAGIDTCAMGYVYITGRTISVMPDGPSGIPNTNDGSWDGFVSQLDSNGTIVWTLQFGGSYEDEPGAIVVDHSTANIFIAGRTQSEMDGNPSLGGWDTFVTSYSSNAAKRWTSVKWIASSSDEEPLDIKLDKYSYVYVTGYTAGSLPGYTNAGGTDGFIYRWDSEGIATTLTKNQFDDTTDDAFTAIAVDDDRNIFIAGISMGQVGLNWTPLGEWDGVIMKLDASGDEL